MFVYLIIVLNVDASWPAGTYGIPMSIDGCPEAEDFKWATGTSQFISSLD